MNRSPSRAWAVKDSAGEAVAPTGSMALRHKPGDALELTDIYGNDRIAFQTKGDCVLPRVLMDQTPVPLIQAGALHTFEWPRSAREWRQFVLINSFHLGSAKLSH